MKKRYVPVDQELNALVSFDEEFRMIISWDDLSEYKKGFVNWHKQQTIEISVVYEGAVCLNVLEQEQIMTAGSAFVVMPGYLHAIRPSPKHENSKYFTLIFHPEILYGFPGSYYEKAYYRPIADCGISYFTFHLQEEWAKDIFPQLRRITEQADDLSPAHRLAVQHSLQNIWVLFAENLRCHSQPKHAAHDSRRILSLISYLHEHYSEKFSLALLAKSVGMSRTECCRYFKKMMNMTITEYLLEYRLSKAAALLTDSGFSVTQVAGETGFCDVSYFIKMFRQKTGVTPKVYQSQSLHHLPQKDTNDS